MTSSSFNPWDAIDLGELRREALSFPRTQKLWKVLFVLIVTRLSPVLDPLVATPKQAKVKREPKPPRSLTRIAEIEKAIALGNALLELRSRAKWNNEFGRLRCKLFDVDTQTGVELMRVARVFGQKPAVYRRLSWQALIELSAASMPWNNRRAFSLRGSENPCPDRLFLLLCHTLQTMFGPVLLLVINISL